MLEDLGVEMNNEEEEVKEVLPLSNIDSEVLRKVIDWCEQHKNDPEPEKEEDNKDGERKQKQIIKLEGWDEEFMSTINYINEQGQSILFDIIIAANYLHIQGLIDITTMEVARKMENKSPEQIRELFKLENDLEINTYVAVERIICCKILLNIYTSIQRAIIIGRIIFGWFQNTGIISLLHSAYHIQMSNQNQR